MSNFKLHTPEELQKIAEEDFERFKEVSKYYLENDYEYFKNEILPILNDESKELHANPDDEIVEEDNNEIEESKFIYIPEDILQKRKDKKSNTLNESSLVICNECKKEISDSANRCPNCGASRLKAVGVTDTQRVIGLFLAIIGIGVLIFFFNMASKGIETGAIGIGSAVFITFYGFYIIFAKSRIKK